MDDWSTPTRAENNALRAQIDSMLDSFTKEKAALLDARSETTAPTTAWSADGLVRVSGNITGISDVHIEPDAFKRSTPASLARSVAEAIAIMTSESAKIREQAIAPLTTGIPDLSDLVPGAPSIKELIAELTPPQQPPATTEPPSAPPRGLVDDSDDEEGDYFRNRSYLR
ncbi:YbaB/EbfC family nucleoid-associated protein [Nocardia sp. NPDC056064]|uniref:YbaB/EbfC family nucleoid-associated protein n=1 Tax=Nocardia sp. NPDC056064 TaxID=3345701 RepID=UPI0035DBFD03